ncbi:MAG: hypothetical protein OHK0057_27420 [Thermoflexibacter sp.]
MPIEIRELVVKMKVVEDRNHNISDIHKQKEGVLLSSQIRKEIIQECVEKVLAKLERMREK